MFKRDVKLFTVKGIPVGLNWTWMFVFVLVFWSLASVLFPDDYPGLSATSYLAMAFAATVLFFASIVIHELSHALQALREGAHVREITLWLFGGVSRIDEPLATPGAEFRVVAAGPAASAVLAAAFYGLAEVVGALGAPEAIQGVPAYLARINALLLAFNVVPALPLDGGRLLHAALWRRLGDRSTATLSAAAAGRAFAFLLIGIGLLGLLGGSGLGGVWIAFLGWFVLQAVHEEEMFARLERAVGGLRVRDLMAVDPITVDPELSIDGLAAVARRSPHGAYPVLSHGRLVGLVTRRPTVDTPRERRDTVRVGDVMLTGAAVPVAHPDESALRVLERLQTEPGRAVVLDGHTGDEVVGLLSATDFRNLLQVAPQSTEPVEPVAIRRRGMFGIWLVVAIMFAIAGAALYHPPFVVIEPGESFDIRGDITITGVPVQQPTGPYLLTSVQLRQPSALGLLVAAFRTDREVIALDDLEPPGVDQEQIDRLQRAMYTDSQHVAVAAAARLAGYDVTLTGTGAEVAGVVSSAPAAAVIEEGDVIVAVDGRAIGTAAELRDAVKDRPAGQTVELTLERSGATLLVSVEIAELPDIAGATGIGVLAYTRDLDVSVPFEVSFRERPEIGGPSAGLAFALAITDMLDESDDAAGRAIAATGTIAVDGTVGAVGGVDEKASAARDAGADVFLVPSEDVANVDSGGMEVRGVADLAEAVELLTAT